MANETVLYLLKQRKISPASLALAFGVHRSLAFHSVNGRGSREIRVAIARLLGELPSTLWDSNPLDVKVLDNYYYLASVRLNCHYLSDFVGLISKAQALSI